MLQQPELAHAQDGDATQASAQATPLRAKQVGAVWFEYLGKVLPVVLPAGARPAAVRQLLCAAFDLDARARVPPAAATDGTGGTGDATDGAGGTAAHELLLRDARGRAVPVSGLLRRGELYRLEWRLGDA